MHGTIWHKHCQHNRPQIPRPECRLLQYFIQDLVIWQIHLIVTGWLAGGRAAIPRAHHLEWHLKKNLPMFGNNSPSKWPPVRLGENERDQGRKRSQRPTAAVEQFLRKGDEKSTSQLIISHIAYLGIISEHSIEKYPQCEKHEGIM